MCKVALMFLHGVLNASQGQFTTNGIIAKIKSRSIKKAISAETGSSELNETLIAGL